MNTYIVSESVSLYDILNNYGFRDVIKLSEDLSLREKVTIPRSVTFDLCGFSLISSDSTGLVIPKGVDVVMQNGTISNSGSPFVECTGTEASTSSIKLSAPITIQSTGKFADIKKRSKLILDGVDLNINTDVADAVITVNGKGSVLDINSSNVRIESTVDNVDALFKVTGGGSIVVRGNSKVVNTSSYGCNYFIHVDSGTGFITGDSYISSNSGVTLKLCNGSEYSVESGELLSYNSYDTIQLYGTINDTHPTILHIIGGKLTSENGRCIYIDCDTPQDVVVDIVGGQLVSQSAIIDVSSHTMLFTSELTLSLQGGEYIGSIPDYLIPEGYSLVDGHIIDDTEHIDDAQNVDDDDTGNYYPDPSTDPTHEYDTGDDVEPTEPDVPETPDTDNSSDIDNDLHSLVGHSAVLSRCSHLYKTPSTRYHLTEFIGVVRILDTVCSNTGQQFYKVQFKLPGSGQFAIGYLDVSNLRKL